MYRRTLGLLAISVGISGCSFGGNGVDCGSEAVKNVLIGREIQRFATGRMLYDETSDTFQTYDAVSNKVSVPLKRSDVYSEFEPKISDVRIVQKEDSVSKLSCKATLSILFLSAALPMQISYSVQRTEEGHLYIELTDLFDQQFGSAQPK